MAAAVATPSIHAMLVAAAQPTRTMVGRTCSIASEWSIACGCTCRSTTHLKGRHFTPPPAILPAIETSLLLASCQTSGRLRLEVTEASSAPPRLGARPSPRTLHAYTLKQGFATGRTVTTGVVSRGVRVCGTCDFNAYTRNSLMMGFSAASLGSGRVAAPPPRAHS